MREDFLIVSTPYLDGYRIERYIGPIFHWTSGAGGVVTDWLARFSGFFGTRSKAYETEFQKYIDQAIERLVADAIKRGANAIIDLEPSFTTMPGDQSMLLILMHGTMVYVTRDLQVRASDQDTGTQHGPRPGASLDADPAAGLSAEALSRRNGKYSLIPPTMGGPTTLGEE